MRKQESALCVSRDSFICGENPSKRGNQGFITLTTGGGGGLWLASQHETERSWVRFLGHQPDSAI